MDPLHATIEEFAADGSTHVECHCPRCRMIRLRPISWLPRISLGLTIAQLSARLRCAECGGQVHSVKPWRLEDVIGKPPSGQTRRIGLKSPLQPVQHFYSTFVPAGHRTTCLASRSDVGGDSWCLTLLFVSVAFRWRWRSKVCDAVSHEGFPLASAC